MPQKSEIDIEWKQHYAWWPVRSSWNKQLIWFRKYWEGNIFYDAMGRPPLKQTSWKLIYTENEYLLMLLREDEKYQHPLSNSKSYYTSP